MVHPSCGQRARGAVGAVVGGPAAVVPPVPRETGAAAAGPGPGAGIPPDGGAERR